MPGDGNMVRCERYKKTPRIPRPSHNRYYYTRSLVIDAKNRPRHQRSRCQSAPRVMDRSHSRSASPRDPARPQHRPPSPPSPPAFENKAYQHDEHDANHNDSFNSNGHSNGHKEPNGDSKTLEAVNLELINLTPKNGHTKKKDVEVDMSGSNPYDEYFVPVNEHRKYMRGEKLYVTADKRGEKGGCKRPLCWTLLGLVVAAIVALIVLAATGILFANSPTPLEPYNASVSSARALGGVTHVTGHDHMYPHDHSHQDHDHHDHDIQESTTENEYESSTEHNNQDESSEERGEILENPEPQAPETTTTTSIDADYHSVSSNESDNSMIVPRTIEGELKIDNKEFTPQLEDPDSDEYAEFVNAFTEALSPAIIYRSPLGNGHNDVKLEIIKLRNDTGSTIVTYRIHWEPKYDNQNSDDLLTSAALETILKNYLMRNDRMISTYHIAEDKMTTKAVLDICKIEKNGCDYECQFNNETLDFTCICPRGQIQDMKHPKQCVQLLNPTGPGSSSIVDVFASVTSPIPTPEPKPTDSMTTEKEIMQDTPDWKPTSNHMVDMTTESDADVSFSHIFGSSATESEKHNTDIYRQQSETSEERNGMTTQDLSQSITDKDKIHTTTMSELSLPTMAPERITEPTPEPEPTSETKSYSEIYENNNLNEGKQSDKTEEPQLNAEVEPEIVHQIIPIVTSTTGTYLAPETQTTTEQIIIPGKKSEPHFVFEQVITAEEPNNAENITTTDVPLVTVTDKKYDQKSHYNLDNQVEETTVIPTETRFNKKPDNDSDSNIKLQENNNEGTTTESEWLEDTVKPDTMSGNYPINHMTDNSSRATEEGRSSKGFGSEFNVDELINELHTTLQYNDTEIFETTTMASDLSREQMTTTTQVPTTTAVSISQIFFGKKFDNDTLTNESLNTTHTTTMPILTEFEGALEHINNASMKIYTKNLMPTFEDVTVTMTTPGNVKMTTILEDPNNSDKHLEQNLLTLMNNSESVNERNNSKAAISGLPEDVTETDITFDAINQLFNRSSKSFQSETINPEVVAAEINDIYKEMTDTTTASDWLTETVSEMNYQDVINENKNRETTETPVTKLDEIISREMNRDDFEPDYLNMGSKTSKSLEHDEPLYGMLQDYDNEESISKRVKNAPGKMVEETTKIDAIEDTTAMKNLMEVNITTIKPTTEANTILDTTTISEYVYRLSSTENNQLTTSTSNSTAILSVPQVWEKPEEDLNMTENEMPKDLSHTIIPEPEQNSSTQNTVNVEESVTQSDNMTQGNNLNVTIYEISNHSANHSTEKSANHQSAEYVDHETEMNPFLPEIENNKSLVKKLQEGHDIEPSNVNETQNENLEEHNHRNLDVSDSTNNQTGISNNGNVTSSSPKYDDEKTVEVNALFNDPLINQNTRGSEEKQVSDESIKDMETTQSPFEQIDDDAKELSEQNFSLPTFLMDTDDLDTTKDPFDRISQIDIKTNKTDMGARAKDDNNFLSVVPIEQDNVEEKQNLKNNYDRENISELNIISDSPKKSDRRTVDSSNVNSLIDNEA